MLHMWERSASVDPPHVAQAGALVRSSQAAECGYCLHCLSSFLPYMTVPEQFRIYRVYRQAGVFARLLWLYFALRCLDWSLDVNRFACFRGVGQQFFLRKYRYKCSCPSLCIISLYVENIPII